MRGGACGAHRVCEPSHPQQSTTVYLSSLCELSRKQRLCLFYGTNVALEQRLGLPNEEVTFDLLLRSSVGAINITAAGIDPMQLKARGAETPERLRLAGFDAVNLRDATFMHQAVLAYGAEAVRSAFVVSPQDAVCVASVEAMAVLNLHPRHLLEICAGAPTQAAAVLQQLPHGCSLKGVPASTVLCTGLRGRALQRLGYSILQLVTQCSATGPDLQNLGFATRVLMLPQTQSTHGSALCEVSRVRGFAVP